MKFNLAINDYQKDSFLCEFIYGDKRRVIKKEDLPKIENAINAYLVAIESEPLNLEVGKSYNLDLYETKETFIKLIETYAGKMTRIELPQNISRSIDGHDLVYAYRNLDEFKNYWQDEESNKWPSLLKQLSEDILEIPYADTPGDYISRFGKVAFHANHGSAHGLRQSILLRALINYIYEHANDTLMTSTLKNMYREELGCLQLAAFLFRSGRTNEYGWKGDPSYSPRSVAIFKEIALALGYDKSMVEIIGKSFDFDVEYVLTKDILDPNAEQKDSSKAHLYQALFHMVHTLELSRCFTEMSYLREQLAERLNPFFTVSSQLNKSVDTFFSLTENFLNLTGSEIAYKIIDSKGLVGFENKYLKVKVVHELDKTCLKFQDELKSLNLFLQFKDCDKQLNVVLPIEQDFRSNEFKRF